MGCPSTCILGENLTFTAQLLAGSGAPVAADGAVSYSVYEDETSTAILSASMAQLASQTGFYSEQIACTTGNGFERFKTYTIRITAEIGSVSVAQVFNFLCLAGEDAVTATAGALTTTANFKTYIGKTDSDDDTLIAALITRSTSAIEAFCNRTLTSDTYRERYDADGTDTVLLTHYPVTDVEYISTALSDVIRITNTASDAYNANVKVVMSTTDPSVSQTMTLTISGGASDGTNDLTLSSYTLTTLVTAINAVGSSWSATLQDSTLGVWDATELLPVSGLECLDSNCYVQTPYEPVEDVLITGQTQSPYRGNNGVVRLAGRVARIAIGWTTNKQSITAKYTAGYATTPADLEQICIDLTKVYWNSRTRDGSLKSEKIGDYAYTMADANSSGGSLPVSIQKRLAPYKRIRI